MQCIGHIDAVPPAALHRRVDNIPGFREDPHDGQDMRKRNPDPLRNKRPALFTSQVGDLAAGRIALELSKRERCRASHQPVYREPPVSEPSSMKALEGFVLRAL